MSFQHQQQFLKIKRIQRDYAGRHVSKVLATDINFTRFKGEIKINLMTTMKSCI